MLVSHTASLARLASITSAMRSGRAGNTSELRAIATSYDAELVARNWPTTRSAYNARSAFLVRARATVGEDRLPTE